MSISLSSESTLEPKSIPPHSCHVSRAAYQPVFGGTIVPSAIRADTQQPRPASQTASGIARRMVGMVVAPGEVVETRPPLTFRIEHHLGHAREPDRQIAVLEAQNGKPDADHASPHPSALSHSVASDRRARKPAHPAGNGNPLEIKRTMGRAFHYRNLVLPRMAVAYMPLASGSSS